MSKPSTETTNVVMQYVAILQADANGQFVPPIINIFGESMDQAAQVAAAKAAIARFASVYCGAN